MDDGFEGNMEDRNIALIVDASIWREISGILCDKRSNQAKWLILYKNDDAYDQIYEAVEQYISR